MSADAYTEAGARQVGVTRPLADHADDRTTGRVHRLFEDLGAFVAGAAALFLVGSLFLGAAIQSPSKLQWTGTAVKAIESGGIAYYWFRGQQFTLDVTSPRVQTGTVYVDPADPSNAMFSNPVGRWTDIATIGGPCATSVLLLTWGCPQVTAKTKTPHAGGSGAVLWRGNGPRDVNPAPRPASRAG